MRKGHVGREAGQAGRETCLPQRASATKPSFTTPAAIPWILDGDDATHRLELKLQLAGPPHQARLHATRDHSWGLYDGPCEVMAPVLGGALGCWCFGGLLAHWQAREVGSGRETGFIGDGRDYTDDQQGKITSN